MLAALRHCCRGKGPESAVSYSGGNLLLTVDSLDGTKAYVRKQFHGIGTMVSLVCDCNVIAAYVGDLMTQEIYGFRPASPKNSPNQRVRPFGTAPHRRKT
jgi:fructose-1,6-bisphosphatase/inositol monophosphatase family enzyme